MLHRFAIRWLWCAGWLALSGCTTTGEDPLPRGPGDPVGRDGGRSDAARGVQTSADATVEPGADVRHQADTLPAAFIDAADGGVPTAPDAAVVRAPDASGEIPPLDLTALKAVKPQTWAMLTGFPEGPSYHTNGSVYLCAADLIRIAPDQKRHLVRKSPCLGTVVLGDGSVLIAGGEGLAQLRPDGKVVLLASASGANDLSVDREGHVYFSASGSVHRLSPDGKLERVAGDIGANGVEVDARGEHLYVTQPNAGQISRFKLPPAGQSGPVGPATVHLSNVPKPDGLAFDAHGNLWVALHAIRKVGIYDVQKRSELARIDVPVETTVQNLAFGGPARDQLFVVGGNYTANARLLRYEVGVPGAVPFPGAASYTPVRTLVERVSETSF